MNLGHHLRHFRVTICQRQKNEKKNHQSNSINMMMQMAKVEASKTCTASKGRKQHNQSSRLWFKNISWNSREEKERGNSKNTMTIRRRTPAKYKQGCWRTLIRYGSVYFNIASWCSSRSCSTSTSTYWWRPLTSWSGSWRSSSRRTEASQFSKRRKEEELRLFERYQMKKTI